MNRTVRTASVGGVIAVGALFLCLFSLSLNAQESLPTPAPANELGKAPEERIQQVCLPRPDASPEMVIIAGGTFQQGSPENEEGRDNDEGPQHEVTIDYPFALSRCEVTVSEFRRFVDATDYQTDGCYVLTEGRWQQDPNYRWHNPGFEQNDQHPAICISWDDAKAYIAWLNELYGLNEQDGYRLPTESEWEYAARAGADTAFYWGSDIQCNNANGLDASAKATGFFRNDWIFAECDDQHIYTAPVASFAANPWNLYDMSGNVWEWTEDCWHDNYEKAPTDGSAWKDNVNNSCQPVLRGGGWDIFPSGLRAAVRLEGLTRNVASLSFGFRLARTL